MKRTTRVAAGLPIALLGKLLLKRKKRFCNELMKKRNNQRARSKKKDLPIKAQFTRNMRSEIRTVKLVNLWRAAREN